MLHPYQSSHIYILIKVFLLFHFDFVFWFSFFIQEIGLPKSFQKRLSLIAFFKEFELVGKFFKRATKKLENVM